MRATTTLLLAVLMTGCSLDLEAISIRPTDVDGGPQDSGPSDGGKDANMPSDAGSGDAGMDATMSDDGGPEDGGPDAAMPVDAGPIDAGVDAGPIDAGVDAGTPLDAGTDACTLRTYYLDNDGDGYGSPLMTMPACASPSGYVAVGGDCDDSDPTDYDGVTSCATTIVTQTCNHDGLGYTTIVCEAGQSCLAGACAVRCGDGIVGMGETCDDGNTLNGDGCSSTCATPASGWVVQLSENFDDGIANGWTMCRGCAGLGCPSVSSGSYRYPGDWNKPCTPSIGVSTDTAIRFDFRLAATTSLTLLAIRRLGTPEEGVSVDFGGGSINYDRLVGGVWITDSHIVVTLPARPATNLWSVVIDRAAGSYYVQIDGFTMASGTAMVGSLNGTWGLDLYGASAVNATVDDVVISTRP